MGLREKSRTVNSYIKKEHKSLINNLTLLFKELEKEGQTKLNPRRKEEIIKIKAEANKIENGKQ